MTTNGGWQACGRERRYSAHNRYGRRQRPTDKRRRPELAQRQIQGDRQDYDNKHNRLLGSAHLFPFRPLPQMSGR